MKQILIYKQVIKNGEYDILERINYSKIAQTVQEEYHGVSPNWANRLWLQGIYSEIASPENHCEFLHESMSADEINHRYDLIILPMANIFWAGHIKAIEHMADVFEKIKVPTFVIACGVQADCYDDLPALVKQLEAPASRFIRAIYQTGGEFALRGQFTKEFFDCLGFHSAVVTGCPSLFQFGRSLNVQTRPIEPQAFRPVLNGRLSGVARFLREYRASIYFDQCDYFDLIYPADTWGTGDYRSIQKLVLKYGFDAVWLAAESRVKLFPEMQKWYSYLKKGSYNFSFGSRIHGNVMSILSGIPSVVWACDSRTREMAEYFDIPYTLEVPKNLYDFCGTIDYSSFNQNFKKKFENFEAFLRNCGIVKQINEKNLFLDPDAEDDGAEELWSPPPDCAERVLRQNQRRLKVEKSIMDVTQRFVSRIRR